MATPAQALSSLSTKLSTTLSATRMGSDYTTDREAIPSGSTRFQIRAGTGGTDPDSNARRSSLALSLFVHHNLADPDDERAYTENAMQSALATILDPGYWRVAEVHQVLEDPEVSLGDIVREGNVISYTLTAVLSIKS